MTMYCHVVTLLRAGHARSSRVQSEWGGVGAGIRASHASQVKEELVAVGNRCSHRRHGALAAGARAALLLAVRGLVTAGKQ
eukprot:COSAG04_NODE_169_length_21636_cov_32.919023_15_plen_81_part_00